MFRVWGGENQRGKAVFSSGYSETAHFNGKPSYLELNSQSRHVPIEGVYRITEKIERRVTIGGKHNQNHAENEVYLDRIRNRMQKPVEGLFAWLKKIESRSRIGLKTGQNHVENYTKGGYRQKSHNSSATLK